MVGIAQITEPTPAAPQHRGLPLDTYVEELFPVAPEHSESPDATVAIYDLLRSHESYIRKRFCYKTGRKPFDEAFDYERFKGGLPFSCFSAFSFDELCKIWYSASTTLEFGGMFYPSSEAAGSGDDGLDPHRRLVGKIVNSMWRWGHAHREWNTVVAFYTALRRFDFGAPGFAVTLDHTTWQHDRGYARYTRTYLDGSFGYLIHYKGEHVLTIGFSAGFGKRVLVNQVQMVKKKGNRWLYRLPMSCVDYALARLAAAFPPEEGFALHLVDGGGVALRIKESYREPEHGPDDKTLARVAKTYSAPLANYVRRGYTTANQLRFHRLVPRPVLVAKHSGFIRSSSGFGLREGERLEREKNVA